MERKKTCCFMWAWVDSVDKSWELRLGFREKYEVILWEKSCGWCLSESRLSTKYWKNVRSDFDDELVLNELVR